MDSAVSALIGATIGVTGGFVQKLIDMRTERNKWLRSRRDIVYRDIRLAAGDLATKIAEFVHSTMWLTYSIDENDDTNWEQLRHDYLAESHTLLAAVKGAEVRLAAMDSVLRRVFEPLVHEAINLSERADKAVAALSNDEKKDSDSARNVNEDALTFITNLPQQIADLLDEKSAVRSD